MRKVLDATPKATSEASAAGLVQMAVSLNVAALEQSNALAFDALNAAPHAAKKRMVGSTGQRNDCFQPISWRQES